MRMCFLGLYKHRGKQSRRTPACSTCSKGVGMCDSQLALGPSVCTAGRSRPAAMSDAGGESDEPVVVRRRPAFKPPVQRTEQQHGLVSLGLQLGYGLERVQATLQRLAAQLGAGEVANLDAAQHQDAFLDMLDEEAIPGSEIPQPIEMSDDSETGSMTEQDDSDSDESWHQEADREDDFFEIVGIKHAEIPPASKRPKMDQAPALAVSEPARKAVPGINQGKIESFFRKAPAAGTATAAQATSSAAAPAASTAAHQQQQQATSWNAPASAEERRLGLAELANLKVFNNRSFRPLQQEVIQAAMQGSDVFVLMPTGGGKSLCYQLPAVISQGITIVVCPLLSLMQDQVHALCRQPACGGVPATYISSQQSKQELVAVLRELSKPRPTCKLLYVTPEQLVKSSSLNNVLGRLHAAGRLARLVIDEAHCVSMWGHDFRPDYKQLGKLRTSYPGVPIMAVTATATDAVAADIRKTLCMPQARTFKASFYRSNLHFSVVEKLYGVDEDGRPQPASMLIDYVYEQGEDASGVVYCLSRDESEHVSMLLEQAGIKSAHYHAGMTAKQRMEVQNEWRSGVVQVVVATIAFGMGIDKPDVRFVAHYTLSKSVEGYFQEAGRAGRDGKPSKCVIFYAPRDIPRINNLIRMGPKKCREVSQAALQRMMDYCASERCRHQQLLEYFSDAGALPGGRCRTCCDNCQGVGMGTAGTKRVSGKGKQQPHATKQPTKAPSTLGGFVKASTLPINKGKGRAGAGKAGGSKGKGAKGKKGAGPPTFSSARVNFMPAAATVPPAAAQPQAAAAPAAKPAMLARQRQLQQAAVQQQQDMARARQQQQQAVNRSAGGRGDDDDW